MLPFIRIGNYIFESYTVVTNLGTVLGLFAAYGVLEKYCKKEKFYWKLIPVLMILMLAGGAFAPVLKGLFGGTGSDATHFLGRVLLAAVILPFFLRLAWRDDSSRGQALNAAALYLVIQHFFSRAACWMNGCCGGIYLKKWNMHFPSQIFEAVLMLVLLWLLLLRIRKGRPFFYQICAGYGLVIFISEYFIDQPQLGRVLSLTSIQVGAAVLVLYAAAVLVSGRRRRTEEN